jgi:hypothetical protein
MRQYIVTTKVNQRGEIVVSDVPFIPGTEVTVKIQGNQPSEIMSPTNQPGNGVGLRWEGTVLVHDGIGIAFTVSELRNERLDNLTAT